MRTFSTLLCFVFAVGIAVVVAGCADSVESGILDSIDEFEDVPVEFFRFTGVTGLFINESMAEAADIYNEYINSPEVSALPVGAEYCVQEEEAVNESGTTVIRACFRKTPDDIVLEFSGLLLNDEVNFVFGFGMQGYGEPLIFSQLDQRFSEFRINGQPVIEQSGISGTVSLVDLTYAKEVTASTYPAGKLTADLNEVRLSICFDGSSDVCAFLTGGEIGSRYLNVDLDSGETTEIGGCPCD